MPWFARVARTLRREISAADALHAPIPGDIGTVGMLMAHAMKKPLFVRHCGNWANQRTAAERFWRWFLERFAGGRTVVFATGQQGRLPSRRNEHIRWIFATSLDESALKTLGAGRPPVDLENPVVVTVGRQEPGKRADLLVGALPALRKRVPGLTLEIIGDGSAIPDLRRQAETLGVSEAVKFRGKLSHDAVLERLQWAAVFALPSDSEGFPKAALEALACGLPLVATDLPVLSSVLSGGGGVLLSGRAPEHVVEAVSLCVSEPEAYTRLSQAACRAASTYSLERWRDEIGAELVRSWSLAS